MYADGIEAGRLMREGTAERVRADNPTVFAGQLLTCWEAEQ
jgi:hypothetical protein